MPESPRISRLATTPTRVVWSNGGTFDGYLLLTLSLPSGYTKHKLKNSLQPLTIPQTTKVPIVDGVIDQSTGVYYNADVNPPGTTYSAAVYDTSDTLIGSVVGTITVSAETTTVTIPTLTVPV